ncbi:MAG: type II secretion system minor pseudopilin GspK [Burkholderiales bacterium]|nr:type II secretion system minor pseudopilin GspK [Burkholderiales bacterium]
MKIRRQRGTAIITALLVVLLAASIAAAVLTQQSHALTRTVRATERAQALLYAQPAMQWARAVLAEFLRNNTSVDLTQRWAQPLGTQPVEGALLTGFFRDESSRFNVNNLVTDDGKQSEPDVAIFKRLLENGGLNADLAYALADWIDKDDETSFPGGAEDLAYLALPQPYRAANQRIVNIEELYRVKGFDVETFSKLKPFITALPGRSKININTAPQEVLAAALLELGKPALEALMRDRLTQPFKSLEGGKTDKGIKSYLKDVPPAKVERLLDFTTSYFSFAAGISNGTTQIRQTALFQRVSPNTPNPNANAWPRIIWVKED